MDKKFIASVVLIFIWLLLFCVGFLIDSTSFRKDLNIASKSAYDSTVQVSYSSKKMLMDTVRVIVKKEVTSFPSPESPKEYVSRMKLLAQSFFGTIFTWTPTNIAFLSILSGLIGSLLYLINTIDVLFLSQKKAFFVGGAIQGFAIYLMLISGVFLVTNDPFGNVTAGQYVRLAGLVSLASFTCGHNPKMFISLLNTVTPTPKATEKADG